MAGRGTTATVALERAKIPFTVHEYAHDPRAVSYDRHRRRDHRPGRAEIPEMPEREEQEYPRMLPEDPGADGTEIDSGWTEGTDDE